VQGNVTDGEKWFEQNREKNPDGTWKYDTIYGKGDPTGAKRWKLDHDECYMRGTGKILPTTWVEVARKK